MLNNRQQILDTENMRIVRMTKPKGSWWWSALVMAALLPSVLFGLGCESTPEPARSGQVLYVQIRDGVSPQDLHVSIGDEIRWQNLRSKPVKIGLLGTEELEDAACAKGFKRFGQLNNFAIIPPNDYVSLCVSHRGTIQYNVWMDPDDMLHSMSRTATIHIDRHS